MAVIDARLDWRGSSADLSSDDGVEFSRSQQETWTVTTDSASDNEQTVLTSPLLPQYGAAYTSDFSLRAKKFNVTRLSLFYFKVEITYETVNLSGSTPLDLPIKIHWTNELEEEDVDVDADGRPLTTTAGEAIEGFRELIPTLTMKAERNLANFDINEMEYANLKTNVDTFMGAGPGRCLLLVTDANPRIYTGFNYWKVEFTVKFRRPTNNVPSEKVWWRRYLNRGYKFKSPVTGKPIESRDGSPSPFTTPQLLSEDGTRFLAESETPYWNLRRRYDSAVFAATQVLG